VEAAMEAGERMAKSLTGVVCKHIIPRPTQDTEKMLKLCAFDKS
jgi:microcompartment protein CcmL/EutN